MNAQDASMGRCGFDMKRNHRNLLLMALRNHSFNPIDIIEYAKIIEKNDERSKMLKPIIIRRLRSRVY